MNKNRLFLLIYIFINTFGIFAIHCLLSHAGFEIEKISPYCFAFSEIVMGIITFAIYKKELVSDIKKNSCGSFFKRGILCSFLVLAVNIVFGVIYTYLINLEPVTSNQAFVNGLSTYLTKIDLLLFECLFGPLSEEFLFRYIIQGMLVKKSKPILGVLITAAIFSVFHSGLSLDFIRYFPGAIILGGIYYKTNDISTTIFSHAVNNFILLLL